jgi:hypothetical protein
MMLVNLPLSLQKRLLLKLLLLLLKLPLLLLLKLSLLLLPALLRVHLKIADHRARRVARPGMDSTIRSLDDRPLGVSGRLLCRFLCHQLLQGGQSACFHAHSLFGCNGGDRLLRIDCALSCCTSS